MTEPTPTKLDAARGALHAALQRTLVAMGWPADRAHAHPPAQPVAPVGWVDVPTVHQAPTEAARAVAATFPVLLAVDGADTEQVKSQDRLLAQLWTELERIDVPGVHSVAVNTAGPVDIETGAGVLRGLQFQVQLSMLVRTFCPDPIIPT